MVVRYRSQAGRSMTAVEDVSFDIRRGETLALVGETGCGKTSTGRAIVGLPFPSGGKVIFDGIDLDALPAEELRRLRPRVQMIYQDPISSLNPRRRARDIVAEPLRIWGRRGTSDEGPVRDARVAHMMEAVGLDSTRDGGRRPREFSGGQCQRIAIARALTLDPELLICDEPVSALDVAVQAQILNLLEQMKRRYKLTMLFISHDLAVVHHVADRVAVMYLGKIVEIGAADQVFSGPAHHYTAGLLASLPDADTEELGGVVPDDPPSALDPPSGCRFRLNCPAATDICGVVEPPLRAVGGDQFVACHFPLRGPVTSLA